MTLSKVCDPAGDLVLKVGSGDEVILIRVHSKVLSLASPVFASMLSPRFAEGKALEDNKGLVDSTTTIDLPEDDPEVMSWLCGALHFKEDAAQELSRSLLVGLAVICDKYNMSRALSPWSHNWMDPCSREAQDSKFNTAWVSYALGHHESFWKNTREIVHLSNLAEINLDWSELPDNAIASLRIQRKELLDQLQSTAESLVVPLLEHDYDAEEQQGGIQSCENLIVVGKYLKCLSRYGLWPISNIQNCSISKVSRDFERFKNHKYDPAGQYMGETISSTPLGENLQRRLCEAVNEVESKLTGLCLSCVKHGTSAEKDGNCHAVSEEFCSTRQVDEHLQGDQGASEDAH